MGLGLRPKGNIGQRPLALRWEPTRLRDSRYSGGSVMNQSVWALFWAYFPFRRSVCFLSSNRRRHKKLEERSGCC
jgi:hypothetical protein